MIIFLGDIPIKAYRCKKPMMNKNQGRVWRSVGIEMDNKPLYCWLDTYRGNNIYFTHKNIWYRLALHAEYYSDILKKVCTYAFNPLSEEIKFRTKEYAII